MTPNPIRKTAILLVAAMMLPTAPLQAATVSRQDNAASPRGWSSIAGKDPRDVREMARTLPLSDQTTKDQPWCGRDSEIETALQHDFGEAKVATNTKDTALWGSDQMGTWTMVLQRPDDTSCIIASGIGFNQQTSPASYFVTAGLGS
ncbi:hypothetical protein [Paracoccus aestuariivivens]|uniref:Uncharacterized protein n=1 Tax=Paracoccus aestuariivivens TaxID=1820333 RepID=A0A6L6JDK2_9RHOB|nr:hypothetical protein [Paracoccus aestuariivivens]MTH80243.1 hypothetical protein [Paracoccus aestuariivivens]